MFIKTIEKTNHSEWVVRNSLYWMSAYTRWQLGADDNDWIVSFESFDDTIKFEFERFLNDYKLREAHQSHTGHIRASIISTVLRSIDARLTE